jgi:Sad1 / UNC-like C-terminal.
MNTDSNSNQGDPDSGRPPLPMKTPSKHRGTQPNADNPLGISPPGMRLRSGTKKPPTPLKATLTSTTRKRRRRSEDDSEDEGSRGGRHRGEDEDEDDGRDRSFVKRSRAAETEDVMVHAQNENALVEKNQDEARKDDVEKISSSDEQIVIVSAEQKEDSLALSTTTTLPQESNTSMDLDESEAIEKVNPDDINNESRIDAASTREEQVVRHESNQEEIAKVDHVELQENLPGAIIQEPTTTPTRVIQPMTLEGLKLPSQHTPGPQKFTSTYVGRNKMKDFMTPAKVVLRRNDQILSDRDKDNSSGNGTDSEMEKIQLKMIQGAVEIGKEEEEREQGRRDGLFHYISDQEKRHQTVKTGVLISVLLTMHMVMAYLTGKGFLSLAPSWVWSDMNNVANHTLELYRQYGIIGPSPEPIKPKPRVVEKVVNKTIFVDNDELLEQEKERRMQRKRIDLWKTQKANIESISEEYSNLVKESSSNVAMVHDKISKDIDDLASQEEKLLAWERALDQAKAILNDKNVGDTDDIYAVLREIEELSEIQLNAKDINIIETSTLSIPGEQCSGMDVVLEPLLNEDEFVTMQDIENAKSHLITSTLSDITNQQHLFRPISDWMDEEIRNQIINFQLGDLPYVDDIQPVLNNQIEPTMVEHLDTMQVQAIINHEIEKTKADATGKHDYASLRSGAAIISEDPLGTSPSLVQNLPLGNQLMSKLGLRFYGHGPDAALEPTFPRDSLGQCWSFEKDGDRKRITIQEWNEEDIQQDPNRGSYATLAVRLSKPIDVTEISIEHVPKTLSSNRDTAIKNFRVFGFEDEDALGYPWLLAESQYDSQSHALQEFPVQTELLNGTPIPRIASVVLAIDDNWGAEYSCLYRFRVHGMSEERNT